MDAIQRGFAKWGDHPIYCTSELHTQVVKAATGDPVATDNVYGSVFRVVISELNKYLSRTNPAVHEDLFQGAMIAVSDTIKRYAPEHANGSFLNLLKWSIRTRCRQLLQRTGSVTVPRHSRVLTALKSYMARKGLSSDTLDVDQAAAELGVQPRTIRYYNSRLHSSSVRADVRDVTYHSHIEESATTKVRHSEMDEDPMQAIATQEEHSLLLEAMGHLKAREREAITLRFGLDGGGERKLHSIAKQMKVTPTSVRNYLSAGFTSISRNPRLNSAFATARLAA